MKTEEPTRNQLILAIVILLLGLVMINWITLVMIKNLSQFFFGVVNSQEVFPTYAVILPLIIGCTSIDLLAVLLFLKALTGEKFKAQVEKGARACFVGCFIGAVSMFANPVVHYALNEFAANHGYHVCKNSRGWKWLMFRTQYVLNPKDCRKN